MSRVEIVVPPTLWLTSNRPCQRHTIPERTADEQHHARQLLARMGADDLLAMLGLAPKETP